jgi:hypothetical protein
MCHIRKRTVTMCIDLCHYGRPHKATFDGLPARAG